MIHYAVTTDPAAHTATFLTDAASPAFRLTYTQLAPDQVRVTFEISTTGKATDFKPYVAGVVTRQK